MAYVSVSRAQFDVQMESGIRQYLTLLRGLAIDCKNCQISAFPDGY
jgi:hypothetical protein